MAFPLTFRFALLAAVLGGASACATFTGQVPDDGRLPEIERVRVQELFRELDAAGEELWPGFTKDSLRFAIVGAKYQWAFNYENVSGAYRALEIPKELRQKIHLLAVASASDPSPTSGVVVKTVPVLDQLGQGTSSEDWIHSLVGELFRSYERGFRKPVHDADLESRLPGDRIHQSLVKLELTRVARAACAEDILQSRSELADAMRLRKARWEYIQKQYGRDPSAWERSTALEEGTTRYVERKLMALLPRYREETLFEDDKYFQEFQSYRNLTTSSWCEAIDHPTQDRYWVLLGWGYALALDRYLKDWKAAVLAAPRGYDDLLARLVPVP